MANTKTRRLSLLRFLPSPQSGFSYLLFLQWTPPEQGCQILWHKQATWSMKINPNTSPKSLIKSKPGNSGVLKMAACIVILSYLYNPDQHTLHSLIWSLLSLNMTRKCCLHGMSPFFLRLMLVDWYACKCSRWQNPQLQPSEHFCRTTRSLSWFQIARSWTDLTPPQTFRNVKTSEAQSRVGEYLWFACAKTILDCLSLDVSTVELLPFTKFFKNK